MNCTTCGRELRRPGIQLVGEPDTRLCNGCFDVESRLCSYFLRGGDKAKAKAQLAIDAADRIRASGWKPRPM